VRVVPVEIRSMARTLETTSKLESEREVEVFPRASGVLLEVLVEEGDVVAEGAALARMDDRQQQLAVHDAEVALQEARNALDKLRLARREAQARVDRTGLAEEQARRDFERNQKLFAGEKVASVLSQSALEASRLALDNARADRLDAELAAERAALELAAGETAVQRAAITLERSQVDLAYTTISAPYGGVIARRDVRVGDSVGPSAAAFLLTDVSALKVVFSRPQEELGLFADVGTTVATEGDLPHTRLALAATADAFPGHTFEGWVERMSPTIEPQSGQFRVTGRLDCELDGGRVRLLPGMLVRLSIVTDRHPEARVVPKRSLDREGERRFVLVVDPEEDSTDTGKVRRVEVREGYAQGDLVEILPAGEEALTGGELVVVVGGRDLTEGDAVRMDRGEAVDVGTPEAARAAPATPEDG
jgi:membrane fusion protein (multidrug efflux system)